MLSLPILILMAISKKRASETKTSLSGSAIRKQRLPKEADFLQ